MLTDKFIHLMTSDKQLTRKWQLEFDREWTATVADLVSKGVNDRIIPTTHVSMSSVERAERREQLKMSEIQTNNGGTV